MDEEKSEQERLRRHRKPMTPELRRFLGAPRSLHDQPERETPEAELPPPEVEDEAADLEEEGEEDQEIGEPGSTRQRSPEDEPTPRPTRSTVALSPAAELSRATQMQTVALIIGGLVLLAGVFYVGVKFQYLKYLIFSKTKPKLEQATTDKFPGLAVEDLIEQGLAAERLGDWNGAAERYMAAKRKNPAYRGILFRVGKLHYDHASYEIADKILEYAIGNGEDVAVANYLRGTMASARNNLPAAAGFFEAAINAEPFSANHYYNLAETLRRDHRPHEAAVVYERGAARLTGDQERAVYQFRARMARLEAGEAAALSEELEAKQRTGKLSVDWLLTAAALRIREGNIPDSIPLIEKARAADYAALHSLFSSCVNDMFFASAAEKYPEVAKAFLLRSSAEPTGP